MDRVLITTSSFGKEDYSPVNLLQDAGYDVILNPHGRKLSEDEISQVLLDINPIGMIAGVEPLNARVLAQAKRLKVISRCGVGLDNVDLDAAKNNGIIVLNTPDAPTQAVAELAIGLIFDLLRKFSYLDRGIRRGIWTKETGLLLQGRNVGIIGLGRIGKRVTEMLLALGAKVAGTDIRPDNAWLKKTKIPLTSFDELIRESEIISLHISNTVDNVQIIGEREIESMRNGSYLVNLSRGGLIDENALYSALLNRHLSGAALDVFVEEPYKGSLTQLDNVILTPHIGSYARESRLEMERQAATNLLSVIRNHS